MRPTRLIGAVVVAGALTAGSAAAEPLTGNFSLAEPTRVSVGASGQADGASSEASMSADGRYVAFESLASNLVDDDTNGVRDVFVRDRQSGVTVRASVGSSEQEANGNSFDAKISPSGRFVAFTSGATNLVSGVSVTHRQVYRRDLVGGTTSRISRSSTGGQPNERSNALAVSDDGHVVYRSRASNLVDGDTNDRGDTFARRDGTNIKITAGPGGGDTRDAGFSADITPDGRFVAFDSDLRQSTLDTNNYSDVYRRDMQTGAVVMVSRMDTPAPDSLSSFPSISDDGNRVAFFSMATNLVGGDTNNEGDVFVTDISARTITRASVATNGAQGNFWSLAPAISGDGAVVVFHSHAGNLVTGDDNARADIFVRKLQTQSTFRISVPAGDGEQGNGHSSSPAASRDGRIVAYQSDATNLVRSDTNNATDVFVS